MMKWEKPSERTRGGRLNRQASVMSCGCQMPRELDEMNVAKMRFGGV